MSKTYSQCFCSLKMILAIFKTLQLRECMVWVCQLQPLITETQIYSRASSGSRLSNNFFINPIGKQHYDVSPWFPQFTDTPAALQLNLPHFTRTAITGSEKLLEPIKKAVFNKFWMSHHVDRSWIEHPRLSSFKIRLNDVLNISEGQTRT